MIDSGGEQLSTSEAAARCIAAFDHCLQQPTPDIRATSLIEDELARFSLWTSYLKVFVAGRASLDHRLREAPDVLQLVLGLLEALEHRIQDCQYCFRLPTVHDLLCLLWHMVDRDMRFECLSFPRDIIVRI
jgi:hypothetical protein